MAHQQHYQRAPITEAIIDLRMTPRADLTLDHLKRLCELNAANYPSVEPTIEAMGLMHVRPGVSAMASAEQKQTGFRCTDSSEKYVCQLRLNGFTLSRLAPYESWGPFRDEARRLWQEFRKVAQPTVTTRLALRYINRIDIPQRPVELKDYFRTFPEVSPDLPQELVGFFMQLRIPQAEIAGQLLINQTIVPPTREDVVSVILDLDLFQDEQVAQDDSEVWDSFEVLHTCKNDIFESCITNKTRELFRECQS